MTKTKREREEGEDYAEEQGSYGSASSCYGARAAKKPCREDCDDQSEDLSAFTLEDYPLFVLRRHKHDPSLNYVEFKPASANIKNVIQQLTNPGSYTNTLSTKFTVDELFLSRDLLRILGTQSDDNTMELSEKVSQISVNSPSLSLQSEDETFQRRVRQAHATQRQTYAHFANGSNTFTALLQIANWVTEECKDRIIYAKSLISQKQVNFDGLSSLFVPGAYITGILQETGSSLIGYRVLSSWCQFQAFSTGKIKSFYVRSEYIVSTGDEFLIGQQDSMIPYFPGSKCFDALPLVPMDTQTQEMLNDRGRKYCELSQGHHYMAYAADSFVMHKKRDPTKAFDAHATPFIRGTGRLMLDTETGKRLGHHPGNTVQQLLVNYQNTRARRGHKSHGYGYQQQQQDMNTMDEVPKSMLCICWPAIAAFSFSAKIWGHVLIEGVSPIAFNDQAFDQLVLAPERKELIYAMVDRSEVLFKDIINGKGGGCVFLLHGPPGCGKTLTAEAISEVLHRPLYCVTMGELGSTAAELEANIGEILELVTVWPAFVLLDEADIFLEKRTQTEILRNAMVGVLLRQIEYFQGVLFLTTNRVAQFDEAFHSRITVALQYKELSQDERVSVWKSLLKISGILNNSPDIDPEELGKFPINGRQIKNSISLAQGLASRAKTNVITMKQLCHTISISLEFKHDMETARKFIRPQ